MVAVESQCGTDQTMAGRCHTLAHRLLETMGGQTSRTMADLKEVTCRWPFAHISIDVYGNIRPCCAWKLDHQIENKPNQQVFNINRQPLSAYTLSEFYKELSSEMKQGQWGVGCGDCVQEHKAGIEGTRESGMRFPLQHEFNVHDVEIKFGNLCNQGCIMCSPMNSSVLEQESLKNKEFDVTNNKGRLKWHFDRQTQSGIVIEPWYDNEERFNEVVQMSSKAKTIKFRGGEPTVNKYLQKFLDKLSVITTEPEIFVNTNAHTFTQSLQDSLSRFPRVLLSLSIDGFGALNEYIRWPNNWNKLEKNVDRMIAMPNTEVFVSSTVQLMNVGEMEDLVLWSKDKGMSEFLVNVVWSPDHWQPCLASQKRKDRYFDLASEHQSETYDLQKIIPAIQKQLPEDKYESKIQEARKWLSVYNKVRGNQWHSIVPNL